MLAHPRLRPIAIQVMEIMELRIKMSCKIPKISLKKSKK